MNDDDVAPGAESEVVAEPEAAQTPDEIVAVPDGTVDEAGERVVYEYDEAGAFVGWHKEAAV